MPGNLPGMDTIKLFFAALKTRALAFGAVAWNRLLDAGRMLPLAILGGLMLWLIATPNPLVHGGNPAKVGILAWLVCKESVLAYLGYWIDRLLHPESRPSRFRTDPSADTGTTALDVARMAAEKRRAFIVSAALLAGGLIQ